MIVDNIHVFDGRQLKERFAYNSFGYSRTLAIGNIISFVGGLNYRVKDKFIAADQCINFCLELPRYDHLSGVLFNRLFITNVAQILSTNYLKAPINVSQNELIIEKEHTNSGIVQNNGILSVNLFSYVSGSFLIYLGLYNKVGESSNPRSFSMNLNADDSKKLMEEVNHSFYFLSNDVFLNTCNVI
jgi:hypothetical protein